MSKFKWRDLLQLNSKNDSFKSPLSILCHIDVNSFYAQVEQVRCGYTKDDPVVCVQWQSLIAVSYAAKQYGITRMDTIQNAMEKCDKLIPIHTAVFKKGEDFWQYHDGCGSWNSDPSKKLLVEQYKVSLDPYRRESRKIFKIFTEYFDLAEKASVDEVFLDLGRLCLKKLMFDDELQWQSIRYLREKFFDGQYDLDDNLPPLPSELHSIEFIGDTFNPHNKPINDWDDVLFALGSHITQHVRKEIECNLGYTTSCGIARTKNICKLASDFKKPNAQTIIRNQCVEDFLDCGAFEITSFWTLGGNLGHELTPILNLPQKDTIKYIREKWPDLKSLKEFLESQPLADDIGRKDVLTEKLFLSVRGSYLIPLTSQTMVKSMTSNKNMRNNACSNLNDCISWLEVFAGELSGRVSELEQEYNKRVIPKTISVTSRNRHGDTHSKSAPFVSRNSKITSHEIQRHGVRLMTELDSKFSSSRQYYPLQNINMSLSNFEVLANNKTVLDMVGGKNHTSKDSSPQSNSYVDSLRCFTCHETFENDKLYQEHMDFEFAQKLSQKLNYEPNSDRKSTGEKRLLEKSDSKLPKKYQKKGKTSSSRNILTYFSK
ncbi:DNA-directed DNA polymerase eta rad30 [Zygosaccharomyces mellis]|uniref:DNA polymerase eta n=1 Tax=Zygosaccharomyces mellis TaxID=42258 RepID=A0A4C2E129_9SACH|nr:DNA-directed DNA polymerase eta rad30 [Zygosaccharomyces mellis]